MSEGMGIALDFDPRAFNAMLKKMSKFWGDKKAIAKIITDWYYDQNEEVYRSKGGSIGHSWSRLSRNYVSWLKEEGKGSGKIHELTGRTRKALTGKRGGVRRLRKSKKHIKIMLGKYPGFSFQKKGTSHPFYIIDAWRPLQLKRPAPGSLKNLDKGAQDALDTLDREVG